MDTKFKVGDRVLIGEQNRVPGTVEELPSKSYRYYRVISDKPDKQMSGGYITEIYPLKKFKPGDRVKITGATYGHYFPIGSLGTIISDESDHHEVESYHLSCDDKHYTQTLTAESLELVNPVKQVTPVPDKPGSRDLTIKMIKEVNSSALKNYCYHNKSLTVTFNNGGVYMYLNVPLRVLENLDQAYSKGTFFHKVIKSDYDFVKLA